ncbi:MAG: ketol-acid reductoisomerase [Candidatus Micrarchaeota archaeon]|nr:ketol-acid reductoisomerase [Candidatus Micrarchaeota archaeon]
MKTNIHSKQENIERHLQKPTIAIIGYGPMGRAFALNLRDSGYNVLVGLRKSSKSIESCKKDHVTYSSIEEAVEKAKIICMLCSDIAMKEVYDKYLKKIRENKVLVFAHGFAITYNLIKPKKNFDVILLAPKGTGKAVRDNYVNDTGTFCLMAVHQNASGRAWEYANELANALKLNKKGFLKTTFREETITDIFGEQAVLCGGVSQLIKYAYETLVENGYDKRLAYLEVLHELKLTVDIIHEQGLTGLWNNVSLTAKYGSLTNRDKIISKDVKNNMKRLLKDIESYAFAKSITEEFYKHYSKNLHKLIKEEEKSDLEKTGKVLREKIIEKN